MQAIFVWLLISIVESKRERQFNFPMSMTQPGRDGQSVDFAHIYRNVGQNIREDFPELEPSKSKKEYPKEAPNDDLVFLSPRDQIRHEMDMNKRKGSKEEREEKRGEMRRGGGKEKHPVSFDYSKLLERNIARSSFGLRNNVFNKQHSSTATAKSHPIVDNPDVDNYFQSNTFLKKANITRRSWTTCDEFKKKAVFHPDDVINTKWLPFYIWSERGFESAVIHTLSYPTKKTVQHYKTSYGPYINMKINWREPKLLLKERKEMLLIAGDRRGLFFGIPEHYFGFSLKGQNISIPIVPLRMKIYDPYLVMMYCDEFYATIMAELNTGPQTESDKINEAESLKFKGKGKPAFRHLEEESKLEDWTKRRKLDQISNKFINTEELIGSVKKKSIKE